MDCLDLLAREDEFKKLNKQLEKKTESLIKQIEHDMQKQDFFSDFSHSLSISPYHTNGSKKHQCPTPFSSENSTPTKKINNNKKITTKKISNNNLKTTESAKAVEIDDHSHCEKKTIVCECCADDLRKARISQDLEFLYAFISVSVQENVLPPSFLKERATVENVCKFLSSKVKLMQEQIDRLQATINKKVQQCEIHLTHQAELESERMTLLNRSNNAQAAVVDIRNKYNAAVKKLEEKDRLYKEQRSESDKLSSEVKRLRAKNASVEARCASLENSVDSLRQQLEAARKAEKDFRDATRSLTSNHQAVISKLEAKIKGLQLRSQKQVDLINNLKEQRALLTAEGAVKVLEKQFNEYLEKF